jgi:predicted  nucleic acid-binding Zn-ribbon protein
MQTVQQQRTPLANELQNARLELEAANAKFAAAQQETERLRRDSAELPRLRGELARLRQEAREAVHSTGAATASGSDADLEAAFRTWAVRASQLKQRLDQMPEKRIAEFQFLKEKNWFDAVKNADKLETDADFREALRDLRSNAKGEFARILQQGLKAYTQATGGQLPTDLSQLKPYFSTSVDDAVLQRYSLLQTGKLSDLTKGEYLVAETAPPVDEEYDTVFRMSLNGTSSSSVNVIEDAIKTAGIQFAEAHDGVLPTNADQLSPYLKKPVDAAQVQKLLAKIPPGITTLQQLKAAGIEPH